MIQETFKIFNKEDNTYCLDNSVDRCILYNHSSVFEKSRFFHVYNSVKGVAISDKSYSDITTFLNESSFPVDIDLMINYCLWANLAYSDSVQVVQEPIMKNFSDNNKELENLFRIFNEIDSGNKVASISLKLRKKASVKPIEEEFLIEDILSVLRKAWSKDVTEYKHSNIFLHRAVFIRWLIINELYNYLKPNIIDRQPSRSQNAALDWIMYFLYYSKIPTSSSNYDISMINRSPIYKNIFENTKFPPYDSLSF